MDVRQRVSGRVSGVQNRSHVSGSSFTSTTHILVFRLTPDFGAGPMHVELRGSAIDGSLVEGELVDVDGSLDAERGVFVAERVVSRDTGLVVAAQRPPQASKVVLAVMAAFALGVVSFIVVAFVQVLRNT